MHPFVTGKKKMTREEAITLARKIGNDKPWYESDVAFLEALGLIKFEEAPGPDCRDLTFSSLKPLAYQAIAQLESLGYTVTLNGKGK